MAGLIGLDAMRWRGLRMPDLRAARAALGRIAAPFGDEPAPDERPADLLVALSSDAGTVSLLDRRSEAPGEPPTAALEPEALAAALVALRGTGRAFTAARILLPPSFCFVRVLPFPSAALSRMRQLLALELEASTPFKAAGALSDWYVESHDPLENTLQVRHVVVARARVAPLTDALAAAGIPLRSILVGTSETALVPVDLLSDGHHPLPSFLRRIHPLDAALVACAVLIAIAAYGTIRWRQDSMLADLDSEIADTRARTVRAVPGVSPAAAAILATLRGRPGLGQALDAVAAALPDAVYLEEMVLDDEGLTLRLASREPLAAEPPLPRVTGFGHARRIGDAASADGRQTTIVLPYAAPGGAPVP